MPAIYRKTGGTWQTVKSIYRKSGGTWQTVKKVWRKTSGAWQLVYQSTPTPSIQTKVEISSAFTGTQTVRLTGKLYYWSNSTGITYQFAKSTDGTNYTNISGASGTSTNPPSGSSNTNDQYVVAQADVTANTTNYYIYISKAVNSTYSTEQTSTSDPISIEAPRNLTLSGSKTSNSITISWSNDTYSGRYEWAYKLSSSQTYGASTFVAPGAGVTSFTVTGLTESTNYDFIVRGWTGTANNYGYYGNWASITIQTNAPLPPNPPTGLYSNSVTKNDFFLGWTSSAVDSTHSAATSYDYGVSTSNSTAPSTLITSGNPSPGQYRNKLVADTNNYEIVGGLSPSTTYYGWVRAKNSAGSSSWAVSSAVTTLALKPPNNVTNLQHDAASRTTISLRFTWAAPTVDSTHDAVTLYQYYFDTNQFASPPAFPNETADNSTNVTIGGSLFPLNSNTTYYFWVRGKNNDGTSASWTGPANGTTLAASNPPGPPSSVSYTNASQSGIGATWSAPTSGGTPTGYKIAVRSINSEPTTESTTSYINNYYDVGNVTSYRTIGLSPGTTYYFWVKAYNNDGTSSSVARNASTAATPTVTNPSWSAPVNFQRTTSTIRWGWNNGTVSPTTGTYTKMTIAGFYWEFYSADGTTLLNSDYKFYTTTNDTRVTVNAVNYPYLLYSGGSSPDIAYSANSRFVRIREEAYDYESATYLAPSWTAKI